MGEGSVGCGGLGGKCRGKRQNWDVDPDDFGFSYVAVCGLLVIMWLGLVEGPGVLPPPQACHAHEHHDDGDQDDDGYHVADHVATGAFDVMVQFSTLYTAVPRAVIVSPAQVLVAYGLLAVQVATTALAAVAVVDDALLPVGQHQAATRALPLRRCPNGSI